MVRVWPKPTKDICELMRHWIGLHLLLLPKLDTNISADSQPLHLARCMFHQIDGPGINHSRRGSFGIVLAGYLDVLSHDLFRAELHAKVPVVIIAIALQRRVGVYLVRHFYGPA